MSCTLLHAIHQPLTLLFLIGSKQQHTFHQRPENIKHAQHILSPINWSQKRTPYFWAAPLCFKRLAVSVLVWHWSVCLSYVKMISASPHNWWTLRNRKIPIATVCRQTQTSHQQSQDYEFYFSFLKSCSIFISYVYILQHPPVFAHRFIRNLFFCALW